MTRQASGLNRGCHGAALDAANTGLLRATGPCIVTPPNAVSAVNRVDVTQAIPLNETLEVIQRVEYDWGTNPNIASAWYTTATGGNHYQAITATQFYHNTVFKDGTAFAPNRLIPADILDAGRVDLWVRSRLYPINTLDTGLTVEIARAQPGDTNGPSIPWTLVQGGPAVTVNKRGLADISVSSIAGRLNANCLSPMVVRYFSLATAIDGMPVIKMTPSDIAAAQETATTLPLTTGTTAAVNRWTTGAGVAIVPTGKSILINPDIAIAANELLVSVAAITAMGAYTANEDVIVGALMVKGNLDTVAFKTVFGPLGATNRWLLYITPNTSNCSLIFTNGASVSALATVVLTALSPFEPVFLIGIMDKSTQTLVLRAYTKAAGLFVTSTIVSSAAVGALTPITATSVGRNHPGPISAAFFRKGVGIAAEYTLDVQQALATYFLENV